MDKKHISLLFALPILALFLFLEVTGVLEVDEQGASARDGVVDITDVDVDTTPSVVEHPELRNVLGTTSGGIASESDTTSDNTLSDPAREEWTQSLTYYPVVRTVDGDTIVISVDGENQTVRLIGVDTPETVHPQKPVECFGREASAFTKAVVTEAGEVALELDTSQGVQDRYGRRLGYIILPDGRNLNALIIYEGYGYEYTYGTPYEYQAEFKLAQKLAKEAKRGLWGAKICVGSE